MERSERRRFGWVVCVAAAAGWGAALAGGPDAPARDKSAYPVFPNEDAGANPAVPAEKGGKGFGRIAAPLGWRTNVDFDLIGDPRAVKGGEFVSYLSDYPTNFRPAGPQSNTAFNGLAEGLMFESLLSLHPDTLEWIPGLASHWKTSADGLTFSYRINPNARWADGSPVTSDDVVATYDLLVDETLGEPSAKLTYGKFDRPVADGPYLVTVSARQKNWRNFLYFSTMSIFPAKVLRSFPDAGAWVKAYNTRFMMGSGPYEGRLEDQVEGRSLTLRRRDGYWAAGARAAVGLGNFDAITHLIINDEAMAFERFKKGELNCFTVGTARRWVLDMRPEKVPEMKRGLIRKVKIFNEQPQGFQGIAFNMNKPPYDDLRVRKALTLLLDRRALLEKLMYNQYRPTRSYYAGSRYENPDNPRNDYDPETALKLLAEAGWKKRNRQGQLVDARGEPLHIRILYGGAAFEKHLTLYQETLKQAGVTATLELTRPEDLWQRVMEKKFEMAHMAWGGLLFPNPETAYRSDLAKVPNNNNIAGVADPRIDALLDAYDTLEIDQLEERTRIVREIDGLLAALYPYVLLWDAPYTRVIFWNVFGMPESGLPRTGGANTIPFYWWWDSEKARTVERGRADPSVTMPAGPSVVRYWKRPAEEGAADGDGGE